MTAPLSYNIKTAAQAVGVSTDTIRKAIRSGDLKATRPVIEGRAIATDLIRREDLEQWALGTSS